MAEAKKADQKQDHGERLGPLHGIPVGIKDVIDAKGMPGEHGSPIFANRVPERTQSCNSVEKCWRYHMGKTVTTEMANLAPSKTRNPHDLKRYQRIFIGFSSKRCGFSCTIGIGTQTGGSVIRPASFNGVHGLKPTVEQYLERHATSITHA